MIIVLGSIFFFAIHNQTKPINAAKPITNNEFAELFTPFGLNSTPAMVLFKLFAANKLKEPPLCSKNAQKKIEKIINTKAANSFLFSETEKFFIS